MYNVFRLFSVPSAHTLSLGLFSSNHAFLRAAVRYQNVGSLHHRFPLSSRLSLLYQLATKSLDFFLIRTRKQNNNESVWICIVLG